MRQQVMGHRDYKLNYFEEAYTTERWLVRIFRVLPLKNRVPGMQSRFNAKDIKAKSPPGSRRIVLGKPKL